MKPIWKFRILALTIFIFVGGLAVLNLAAEFLRESPFPLPSRTNTAPAPHQISSAGLASAVAPFRSDLKAEYALALAGQALKSENSGRTPNDELAKNAVTSALTIGPHDSRMWLVLALLQTRNNLGDPRIAESLKMSYLTGPNRADLIPARLDTVTLGQSLNDPDLKELARSDVRVVLTQLPDLRPGLLSDYVRGSSIGKAFLEESVRTFDPKFVDSVRNAR
jgi:hypothetical protein